MKQQLKQKREALSQLTEDSSPFKDTKTTNLFRNTANLTLKGTTYDATHMDKFLTSQYGHK